MTRPTSDFKEADALKLQATFDILKNVGIEIVFII